MLDTHIVIWLYRGGKRLPNAVERRLEREALGISPIVELELAFLREIGRAQIPAQLFISELSAKLGLMVVDIAASRLCSVAAGISWTRDPFDRLIAAHATATGEVLVTSDEVMLRNLPLAWWAE